MRSLRPILGGRPMDGPGTGCRDSAWACSSLLHLTWSQSSPTACQAPHQPAPLASHSGPGRQPFPWNDIQQTGSSQPAQQAISSSQGSPERGAAQDLVRGSGCLGKNKTPSFRRGSCPPAGQGAPSSSSSGSSSQEEKLSESACRPAWMSQKQIASLPRAITSDAVPDAPG